MTLLAIIQDAANECGVQAPQSVVNNPDTNAARMLALANRGGKALAQRFNWQELTREFSFSTQAQESQGAVSTLMPGFNFDIYESVWNRSTGQPVVFPIYPSEWQALKGIGFSGAYPQLRVRGGQLLANPIPTGGQTIAGEYVSDFWCQSSTGAGQNRWKADTDTGTLNEDWLTLDLVWRWKQALGLTYAEEKQEFEIQVNNAMSRNGNNRRIRLDEGPDDYFSPYCGLAFSGGINPINPVIAASLQLENGGYLLQESGGRILI